MPVISLSGSPHDAAWVWALMLFPKDDALRNQCFAVQRARIELSDLSDADRLEVDASALRLLIDAPAYTDLRALTAEHTKRAIVAGDILAALYLMDKFKVNRPSLNKAVFVAQEYAKKTTYGDGTRLNVSERKIREYWREFQPVAHLWSAFRLNRAYPFCDERDLFASGFPDFIAVAAGLLDFGATFVPVGAKGQEPVLNRKDAWGLPKGVEPKHLQAEVHPDALLRFLKKYKAPKSHI